MSSKLIVVPSNTFSVNSIASNCNIDDYVDIINHSINVKKYLASESVQRGDVIHFKAFGSHKGDGKLISNGKYFIPLDTDYDPYGTVPSDFTLEDFNNNKYYFVNALEHNCIVRLKGSEYQIVAKWQIPLKNLYLYEIKHNTNETIWYVLTSIKSKIKFQDALTKGVFQCQTESKYMKLVWNLANPEHILYGLDLL